MGFIRSNFNYIIALISIFFVLQVSLLFYNKFHEYSTPDHSDLLLRYLAVIAVYALLFYQVYRFRKAKYVVSILIEILTLAVATSIFMVVPVLYARTVGIITEQIGYLYIAEVNMLLALFLSIVVYLSQYISYGLSKTIFFISVNAVFVINCAAIAILYSTGFKIGPTVFLHFSWEALKVGLGEYLVLVLAIVAILVPVNIVFLRLVENHKDRILNYTIVSLAILAVLANSVILNFDLYKTKTILPLYATLDAVIEYTGSSRVVRGRTIKALRIDGLEKDVLGELGINLDALSETRKVVPPLKTRNIITVYLESFQLNFTKFDDEIYPDLTPRINALPDDYVVYTNFINSVTPTINAMISSQCGVNVILSSERLVGTNNQVLHDDGLARDLLQDNLVCLSDILQDAGYYQVLMKGADIRFSSTGKFFKAHGYDKTLGAGELNKQKKYSELNFWGLQDPMLFDEALIMLNTLKDRQPFNLTLLTVNSHSPGYEYSGCPVYMSGNAMLNGIHCTDYALGRFLKEIEQMEIYENTVVVIVGDHVMFRSLANSELFKKIPPSWYGRTYLSIRSPDATIDHPRDIFGITPDLAPTILDLLGFSDMDFISGKSLISERSEYQRIAASGFDIINDEMTPDRVVSLLNTCSIFDAGNERIVNTEQYNECQRAKIHYLQQKAIYRHVPTREQAP